MGEPHDRVGDAPVVNRAVLDALWSAGLTPVVSPVALDKNAEPLNCNADAVAGALAAELRADVLVLLSDIDQLRARRRGPGDVTMSSVTGDADRGDATLGCRARRHDSENERPRATRCDGGAETDPPGQRHAGARRCATRWRGRFPRRRWCDDPPFHDDRAAEPA